MRYKDSFGGAGSNRTLEEDYSTPPPDYSKILRESRGRGKGSKRIRKGTLL